MLGSFCLHSPSARAYAYTPQTKVFIYSGFGLHSPTSANLGLFLQMKAKVFTFSGSGLHSPGAGGAYTNIVGSGGDIKGCFESSQPRVSEAYANNRWLFRDSSMHGCLHSPASGAYTNESLL